MKVHVLQHAPFEDLGSIRGWLDEHGAEVGYTRFFAGDDLPSPDGLDLVIAMGGPMSVNDEGMLPWLVPEKRFVREAAATGIRILGVCLGAQLIASALGAAVYPNPVKEIGWFPVHATESVPEFACRFPREATVFHWHGETFDLPAGATLLATSDACRNQAFQVGRNVVALQFHLEITPASVDGMLQNCRGELVPGPYVQTEQELRGAPGSWFTTANGMMRGVLAYLVDGSRVAIADDHRSLAGDDRGGVKRIS